MFTIMSNGFKGFDNSTETLDRLYELGHLPGTVDILCDTTDDLPTSEIIAKYGFAPGSVAWIANERTYKMLNNAREWV